MIDTERSSAYWEGHAAWTDGLDKSANPWRCQPLDDDHQDWEDGWDDASGEGK